jgi:hypothetical protein
MAHVRICDLHLCGVGFDETGNLINPTMGPDEVVRRAVTDAISRRERVMPTPRNEPTPDGRGYRAFGGCPSWGTWDRQQARFVVTIGKTRRVATLVAEAFQGPRPSGLVCLHINENVSCNRASNLRWGTSRENYTAPGFLQYCRNRTGEHSTAAKARRKRDANWIAKRRQVDMFDSSVGGST